MSKALEMVRTMINGANEYEKKTGDKNPPVYFSKDNLLIIEDALKRLEAIDNSNPSEALECLDGIEYVADVLKVNHKIGSRDIANQEIKEMAARLYYRIPTIKQALLKVQEPKQYLKWEDLEFKKEEQIMKVLLNGERYLVKYVNEWVCGWCNMVQITNGTYILCTLGNGMKQFFNDLHLERVEE